MVVRGLVDVVVDLLENDLFVVVEKVSFGDDGIFIDCVNVKSGEEVDVGSNFVLAFLANFQFFS